MMIKEEIKKLIAEAVKDLQKEQVDFSVEIPAQKEHGDYSTNIAMVLAKKLGKNPNEIANLIKEKIKKNDEIDKIEVAGGFVNFYLSKKYLQNQIREILKQKEKFGSLKIGKGQKINVEFVSANPTGPLTLGNGRGGFCGDVLSNVFEKAGFKITREYYVNDTGNQIRILGHSILGDSEAQYKGKYIDDLKGRVKGKTPEEIGEKTAEIILKEMLMPALKKMGIKFDVWFSEKSLYNKKEVDKVIEELKKKGFTYESEGALWFKSKDIGDDKDRVLIRADGIKTYFASDIAYLNNKFKRGFKKLVFFWGADHHGYINRLKAAAEALGFDKEKIDMIVMQMVRLFENGKEVKMSKRSGIYVTIDELVDEVGLDVVRFFFLSRTPDTQFNFDLNLAKEKSEKNPVYKIQYAFARICSILRKSGKFKILNPKSQITELLKEPEEINLIKQLVKFPEIIEATAKDCQIHRLPQYALEFAEKFHAFYENCQVISEDKNLAKARLALVLAVKIVLKNTLDLMGISAPEKM